MEEKMRTVLKICLVLIVIVGLVSIMPLPADSQLTKSPKVIALKTPVQVKGVVSIHVRPYDTMLGISLRLMANGRPVTKAKVEVEGNNIPEASPGRYQKTIKSYAATVGKVIKVKMDPQPSPSVKIPKITAQATTGTLLGFRAPAPEAKVELESIRTLHVSWNSVGEPVDCRIFLLSGKKQIKEVFKQTGITGTRIMVDPRILAPNQKYGIYLFYTMGKFTFKGSVTRDSEIILRQSVGTYFYTR
jgi:hypothetical protein